MWWEHPWWFGLLLRPALRDTPMSETLCMCCYGLIVDGHRKRSPAKYVWECAPSGNTIELCEACCAIWRANAVDDPELQPLSILLIRRETA